MNVLKRVAAIVLASVVMFSLSACVKKTPDEEVAQALTRILKAESMTSVIDVDMEVAVGGNVSKQIAQATTSVSYAPYLVQIINKSEVGTPQERTAETYAEGNDDTVTVFMEYDKQWMKQSITKEEFLDSLQIYDGKENIQKFINGVSQWKEVSEENKVTTYTGTIPSEKLFDILESTRMLQMIGMTGLTQEYYQGIPALEITLKVDQATNLPISYHADFSPVLQVLMDNVMKNFADAEKKDAKDALKVSKYIVTVSYSKVDKTQKIEIPKEALESAVDFEQQMKDYAEKQGAVQEENKLETTEKTTAE